MIKWCDSNLDDSIYSDIKDKKVVGTYKSTGIVTDVYLSDNRIDFALIQKIGDKFYKSSIYDMSISAYKISDFYDENSFKADKSFTIYYVVSENGNIILLGYKPISVEYTLDEYNDATGSDLLVQKKYDWGDNGKADIALFKERQTDELSFYYVGEVNDYKTAVISSMYFMDKFEEFNIEYSVNTFIKGTSASSMIVASKNEEPHIYGTEENGEIAFSAPEWFKENGDFTEKEFNDLVKGIYSPSLMDFLEEVAQYIETNS